MARFPVVEAVRNRKNHKLFIIVDDSLDKRYKVVNPTGELLILPDLLFEEDPISVNSDQFSVEFTPEQIAGFEVHMEKELERQEAQRKAELNRPPPEPKRVAAAEPPKKRNSAPKPPRQADRRGLGAAWSAPRLTFYKHKIEPLSPKQTFQIKLEGSGIFEISKEDFLLQFNDVVMSASYRSDGHYTYPKMPDKAQRYLKS